MKKALLFYRESYSKEVVKRIDDLKEYRITAVNLDDNIFFSNLGNNVTFKEPWSYFEFSELSEIDKTALNFAKSWYLSGNKNLSVYQDISIGEVIQYEVMRYFVGALKSLSLISKIIEKEEIKEIFLFGKKSAYEKAAIVIGERRNMKVRKLWNEFKENHTREIDIKKSFKLIAVVSLITFHNLLRKRLFMQESSSKKNIFIVNSYRFPSLIKELMKDSGFSLNIFVIGIKELIDNYFYYFFGKKNITLIRSYSLRDLFPKDRDRNSIFAKKTYKNSEENIKKKIDEIGIFGLWELIKDGFPSFLISQISGKVRDYHVVNKHITKDKIGIIIVGQDFLGMQRLVVASGNARGIPSIVLQHGAVGFYPYFVSPISKVVGIWGEKWADWFINLGVESKRIMITGEPFYDIFFQSKNNSNSNTFLERYGIPEGRRIILYANQPNVTISSLGFPTENEKVAYKVCKTIGENGKYHIIFKLRHGDSLDKGLKIVKHSGTKNVTVISKTDNLELLKASDLIITISSTMAFEGMLLNKPVIILNFCPGYIGKINPFLESSGAIKVDKEEDLLPAIERIFEDPEVKKSLAIGRREFLSSYFYFGESSSSQKAVECIKKLCHKKNKL